MATYKTTSLIDFSKTVVISFDTNHNSSDFDFGVGMYDHTNKICGRIDLKGYKNISFDQNIYDVNDNEVIFSVLTENLFSDGYLLQKSNYKNEVVPTKEIFEMDENGFLCSDSIRVKEDTVVFERISDYDSIKDNLIIENKEVYIESKTEEPIAFVFDCGNDHILKLSSENDSLELLSLDYGLTKNLEEESLLLLSHGTKSNNVNVLTTNDNIIRKSPFDKPQRIRFVISNNAKLMSVSLYNNDKKIYEEYTSFTFKYGIEKGYLAVYTNSSSVPSNVSTNF